MTFKLDYISIIRMFQQQDGEALVNKQLQHLIAFVGRSEVMDAREAMADFELPGLVGDLYNTPGPVSEALAGDLIAITKGNVLSGDLYENPTVVQLLQLKLAEDLALTVPERIGLDKQKGEALADMINRATNFVRKGEPNKNFGILQQADKVIEKTIGTMREQNVLHLSRLDANTRFVNLQSAVNQTAPRSTPIK